MKYHSKIFTIQRQPKPEEGLKGKNKAVFQLVSNFGDVYDRAGIIRHHKTDGQGNMLTQLYSELTFKCGPGFKKCIRPGLVIPDEQKRCIFAHGAAQSQITR